MGVQSRTHCVNHFAQRSDMTLYVQPELWTEFFVTSHRMAWDSAYVFGKRTADLWAGRTTAVELHTMISEKPAAFVSSVQTTLAAAALGSTPAVISQTALAPFADRTQANAARLRDDD